MRLWMRGRFLAILRARGARRTRILDLTSEVEPPR